MKLLLSLMTLVYGLIPGVLFLVYRVPYEFGVMIAWGIVTILSVVFLLSRGDDLVL